MFYNNWARDSEDAWARGHWARGSEDAWARGHW